MQTGEVGEGQGDLGQQKAKVGEAVDGEAKAG